MKKKSTKNNHVQKDLIVEFFEKNPNRNIKHPEVVDWVVSTYLKRTGNVFRDPDRAIRHLSQNGFLIKIAKGVYKYDPNKAYKRELEDFTTAQKSFILKGMNINVYFAVEVKKKVLSCMSII